MLKQPQSAPAGAPPQIFARIDGALRLHDLAGAAQLAQQALDQGHIHPLLFDVRGCWRKRNGLLKDALDDLQRAHTLAPTSAKILCELSECLNGLGRHKLAILACGDALAIDDRRAAAWFHKAIAHQMLNQPDRARDCYLAALRLEPALPGVHARLANLAVLQGRHAEARGYADHALALAPGDTVAVMALVRADLAEDQLEDAERRLVWLVENAGGDASLKSIALGLLGDLRDAQGKIEEAFDAYRAAGATFKAAHAPRVAGRESGSEQVRRVTRAFKALAPQSWSAPLQ